MTTENRPLAGKVMVVTGGSRGIGRMIATGLLEGGAKVYIASRKHDQLEAAAADLSRLGQVRAFPADLATPEGVHALADHIAGHESGVHALFNNAGANWGAPLEQFPTAAWDRVMNLNVKGVFELTQALLPLLRSASLPEDPARIVNIGSIDGLLAPAPGFDNFSYSASKAAVHLLTQQLATTLAPEVLVNAIAPGLFESHMTASLLAAGEAAIADQIPLRRIGRPRDMADLAVFLTAPAAPTSPGRSSRSTVVW